MKTIKYIAITMLFTPLLFGCKKPIFKGTEYVIQGRLMHSCDVPAANVEDVYLSQPSQPIFGQKGAGIYFDTDDEGYFEIVYNSKDVIGTDFEIRSSGTILEGIPPNENLDLGEVYWGAMPVSFVLRLEANNSFTANDTLVFPDFKSSNHVDKIYLSGPFNDTILDTIVDFLYNGNYKYNKSSEMKFISWFSGVNIPYETSFLIPDFCNDEFYEAIIKIE